MTDRVRLTGRINKMRTGSCFGVGTREISVRDVSLIGAKKEKALQILLSLTV